MNKRPYVTSYKCGDTIPDKPSPNHYMWHYNRHLKGIYSPICGNARVADAWYKWCNRHPEEDPQEYWKPLYKCSDDLPSKPDINHHARHRRRLSEGIDSPYCNLSIVAEKWHRWLKSNTGRDPSDYFVYHLPYRCSDEIPLKPDDRHYAWHKYYNTDKCKLSREAYRWKNWVINNPTKNPKDFWDNERDPNELVNIYAYVFENNKTYIGISKFKRGRRENLPYNNEMNDLLNSNMARNYFILDTMIPRRDALVIEKSYIEACSMFGDNTVNIAHNISKGVSNEKMAQ